MKTCLIVDDVAFNRKKTRALLQSMGFKVEEAEKATDIGLFFHDDYKGKIDVILMDYHMPEIDGVTFIGLTKGSKYSEIPIFLYSASESSEDMKKLAQNIGVAGYLPKNLDKQIITQEFTKLKLM